MSRFRWDAEKERENFWKHGVGFDEAESVFELGEVQMMLDERHSAAETRFRSVGWSSLGRLLVVITCDDEVPPRIISARRATKRERHAYERRR
jgi:uncharacterized DUF497 family protein